MDALNIALCLVIALSLTNALPVRNRSNENFHDYAREAIPRKRSNLKDLYDAHLLRRDPSEGKWLYIYNALKFCTLPVWLRKLYSSVPSVAQRPITPRNFLSNQGESSKILLSKIVTTRGFFFPR